MKNSATFQLVEQCLNQLYHRVPPEVKKDDLILNFV